MTNREASLASLSPFKYAGFRFEDTSFMFSYSASRTLLLYSIAAMIVASCQRSSSDQAPISVVPPPQSFRHLPSAFPPQSIDPSAPWTVEREVGRRFAREGDYYRAITAFKRALFLLPSGQTLRHQELEFDILLSYALAQRWSEALEFLKASDLLAVEESFPAKRELHLLIREVLLESGNEQGAIQVEQLLPPEDQKDLEEGRALQMRRWSDVSREDFSLAYQRYRKSPQTAGWLNALLPGAGYAYVGQYQSAFTSFLVNGLTLWATITLACHEEYAAAALLGSLEVGWYIGGIEGASLAAHRWNDRLGERLASPLLSQQRLYPLFRYEVTF